MICPILSATGGSCPCQKQECMWYYSKSKDYGHCAILKIAFAINDGADIGVSISRHIDERGKQIEREIADCAAVMEEQGTKLRFKIIRWEEQS